jgi:hypothetical protein
VNQRSFVWQTVDLKVRNAYNTLTHLMSSSEPANAHEEPTAPWSVGPT